MDTKYTNYKKKKCSQITNDIFTMKQYFVKKRLNIYVQIT